MLLSTSPIALFTKTLEFSASTPSVRANREIPLTLFEDIDGSDRVTIEFKCGKVN